jgi:reverse transcriptase-like protein
VADHTERFSLKWLARTLGVVLPVMKDVAVHSATYYRPFPHKHNGKIRIVDRPVGLLKEVQGRIKVSFLQPIQFPESFYGGVKGGSPYKNASRHLNQKCLVKIDIRSFYPSVTSKAVYEMWCSEFRFGPDIARVLTQLTTYTGHLPQGASTSGYLANLALLPSADRIRIISEALQVTDTFFVDDIALSGDHARDAIGPVISAIREAGFSIRRDKMSIMAAHDAQVITGLCVNRRQGPTVPRAEIEKIRCGIHQLRMDLRIGEPTQKLERSLRGRIAYVRRTNRGAAGRLERLLNFRLHGA